MVDMGPGYEPCIEIVGQGDDVSGGIIAPSCGGQRDPIQGESETDLGKFENSRIAMVHLVVWGKP